MEQSERIKPPALSLFVAFAIAVFAPSVIVGRAAMDVVAIVLVVLMCISLYQQSAWSHLWDAGWKKWLWAFVVWMIITAPFAYDTHYALTRALAWTRYPLFGLAVAWWLTGNVGLREHVLKVLLFTVLFIAGDTVLQSITGTDILGHAILASGRLTGPFNKPIPGIVLTYLMFPVIGLIGYKALSKTYRFAAACATLLAIIAVALSGERGALLLMVFGLGLWFVVGVVLTVRRLMPQLRVGKKCCFASFLAVLLLIFAGYKVIAGYQAKEMGASDAEHMQEIRTSDMPYMLKRIATIPYVIAHLPKTSYGKIWQDAISIWTEHPLKGVGVRNYREYACKHLQNRSFTKHCAFHPHNMYLHIAAELGAVGVLLFSAMVVSLLWHLWKYAPRNIIVYGFAIAILVRFWPLIASLNYLQNITALPLWFMVGAALSYTSTKHDCSEESSENEAVKA